MKNYRKLATCLLFLLIFCNQLNADENFTFRKTRWGMSPEEVKASEPLELAQSSDGMIGYKTRVLEKNVFLVYIFAEKRLVRAKYILAENHSNKTDFIQDYKDFQKILTEKYGKPDEDRVIWKNDLYKNDPDHFGTAIGIGHLGYYSIWQTPDSKIICILHGDNYDVKCEIEYSSKELSQIEKRIEKKKQLENF